MRLIRRGHAGKLPPAFPIPVCRTTLIAIPQPMDANYSPTHQEVRKLKAKRKGPIPYREGEPRLREGDWEGQIPPRKDK